MSSAKITNSHADRSKVIKQYIEKDYALLPTPISSSTDTLSYTNFKNYVKPGDEKLLIEVDNATSMTPIEFIIYRALFMKVFEDTLRVDGMIVPQICDLIKLFTDLGGKIPSQPELLANNNFKILLNDKGGWQIRGFLAALLVRCSNNTASGSSSAAAANRCNDNPSCAIMGGRKRRSVRRKRRHAKRRHTRR